MSTLLIKTISAKLSQSRLEKIFPDEYKEMGLCFAKNGRVSRRIFSNKEQLFTFAKMLDGCGALIHCDNPDIDYPKNQISPFVLKSKLGVVSCGDIVNIKDNENYKDRSQLFVWCEEYMFPIETVDLIANHWMINQFLREYVGLAFLKFDGTISIIHSGIFWKDQGLYWMNYDEEEKRYYKEKNKKNVGFSKV